MREFEKKNVEEDSKKIMKKITYKIFEFVYYKAIKKTLHGWCREALYCLESAV